MRKKATKVPPKPIDYRQVIICGSDQVLTSMFAPVVELKQRSESVHVLRGEDLEASDVEVLMRSSETYVFTCWSAERIMSALPMYTALRGWKPDSVRVYDFGMLRKFSVSPSESCSNSGGSRA